MNEEQITKLIETLASAMSICNNISKTQAEESQQIKNALAHISNDHAITTQVLAILLKDLSDKEIIDFNKYKILITGGIPNDQK